MIIFEKYLFSGVSRPKVKALKMLHGSAMHILIGVAAGSSTSTRSLCKLEFLVDSGMLHFHRNTVAAEPFSNRHSWTTYRVSTPVIIIYPTLLMDYKSVNFGLLQINILHPHFLVHLSTNCHLLPFSLLDLERRLSTSQRTKKGAPYMTANAISLNYSQLNTSNFTSSHILR